MPEIRQLNLYPLTGLYNECHNIDLLGLSNARTPVASDPNALRNLNNFWWHQATSLETLDRIVSELAARYRLLPPDIPQHAAILAAPGVFKARVQQALATVANLGSGPEKLFSALETLNIFCSVYGDTISAPFALSLQEGLVVNELSSATLAHEALSSSGNPYLQFIREYVEPILVSRRPNLLWINGPIKMSTFAMAMLARELLPDAHISVTYHATEYYSLAKISQYLIKNDVLFKTIDSIILDDFENTMPQLVAALQGGHSLTSVPNLIFASEIEEDGVRVRKIEETPILVARNRSQEHNTHFHSVCNVDFAGEYSVDPSEIVDIKLWPNTKCYWNNCNFCAINEKYQTLPVNVFNDAESVVHHLKALHSDGVRFFWSYDEAIPPASLKKLATEMIGSGLHLQWETRSKIDRNFDDETCAVLGAAGLREIRLGLESASTRVLSAMGKFPDGWSLDLIEKIVSRFHEAGVSVHFPTIVGFPTETPAERAETYAFLQYITKKYPSVTFNVNILGFDVASKLYKNFLDFGVTSIRWPVSAKHFLGNLVDWDCDEVPFDYSSLDAERNSVMRQLLYDWIPATATLPVYIFYRLAETSRATMVWKARRQAAGDWGSQEPIGPLGDGLALSSGLCFMSMTETNRYARACGFRAYDWDTHIQFSGDDGDRALLDAIGETGSVQAAYRLLVERGRFDNISDAAAKHDRTVQELFERRVLRPASIDTVPTTTGTVPVEMVG